MESIAGQRGSACRFQRPRQLLERVEKVERGLRDYRDVASQ